jgi:hypothetical protein
MPPFDRARAPRSLPMALVTTVALPVFFAAAALLGASCVGNSPTAIDPGSPGTGGGTASAGSGGAAGGSVATGGNKGGTGGMTGAAGRTGAGGMGMGGRTGVGGLTGGGGSTIVVPPSCGAATHNLNPFGCNLAWGMNNPGGSLASYSYLQFMSFWIGAEAQSGGTLNGCSGCTWLTNQVSRVTNITPVFYAYIIGFYGHANGLPDGNVAPSGPNLTTGGANLIRNNRDKIIQMYASYAQQAHTAWGTKPLLWLLEGDFIQYTGTTQTNPLSYAELGQLAEDITCAIKANMPNAVVAINHSTWNTNDATNKYWAAMAGVNYDMTWTSGAGNLSGFFTAGTTATSYNGTTATYAYLHRITGRTIFVDTSFGISATSDSWSDSGAANLNARIADGVVAVNVTTAESTYAGNIAALGPLPVPCTP